ncbi:MFS transporter [Falsiroseomonas selenitidurans]|uniref:MFS transporter n=1 Tax=Falsiroseomonas selenitidurans TaxID=2716335 RepID=A0ABX1EAQ6_9PROT|nr:MFS transporter [Falsiroseomonas selenitidurans]NKC34310.1 MFS transporter [Falsiroseomonas selenitidurans]
MRLFARITLPLAGLNFVNQASRTMIATLGPLLALEFALSASELGLLAAMFFAAYAAAQLPVGLAIDLWGARRVQTVLALVSGLGFLLCGLAAGPFWLAFGRVVTGIGISAGLIAMLKVNTQWYPRDRVAGMTGLGVLFGSLGSIAATLPVAWLVPVIGWRGIFGVLAGLSCLVSLWIWVSVPERGPGAPPPPRRAFGAEVAEFGRIFRHPTFLRFAPSVALLSAMNFTYQGLWAGPWLRDVGGQDQAARAALLFCYAAGLMLGSVGTGQAASLLQRRGAHPMLVPWLAMAGIIAVQLLLIAHPWGNPAALGAIWFLFALFGAAGPAGYAAIGQRFAPELTGRVATAINVAMLGLVFLLQNAIGWILDLWPRLADGGWDPAGYGWALAMTVALQSLAAGWMIRGRG